MSKRSKSEEITINLTPMIDVVFLLIIFFMVGSKFSDAESRIEVNVPSVGEMQSIARVPDARVVSVLTDGTIMLDETPTDLEQLKQTLRGELASYPATSVIVRVEADRPSQNLVEVVHAVKVAGIEKIGIATTGMQR